MLICWSSNHHIQISLKLIILLLVAASYITILYRESLNAIDNNRNHIHKKKPVNSGTTAIVVTNHSSSYQSFTVANISVRDKLKLRIIPVTSNHWRTPVPKSSLSTLNPVYEYSEEIHRATEEKLQQRSKHLQDQCNKYTLQGVFPPRPQEFFISTGHNLIWCNVFKAASSTWMYYFNILGE